MFIIILLLLAFTFYLIYAKLHNTYSIVFILCYLSISMLCFLTIVYINTRSFNIYLFPFEKFLFQPFSHTYISAYKLRTWIYCAISVYITAMYWAASQNGGFFKLRHHLIFAASILLFWFLNSRIFTETLYIRYFALGGTHVSNLIKIIYTAIRLLSIAVIIGASILPHAFAVRKARETIMVYKKRQLTCFSVMLGLAQLLLLMILFVSPINFYVRNIDIENMFDMRFINNTTQIYLTFFGMTLVLIIVSIIFIIKYRVLNEVVFFKRRHARDNIKIELNDMKHVFHSCKNSIILLEMLNQQCLDNIDDTEFVRDNLEQSNIHIHSMHALFAKFLNSFRNEPIEMKLIDCNKLIYDTVGRLTPDIRKHVNISITGEPISVYGDDALLIDAFTNIIINASEAILNVPNGRIDISLFAEDSMACFIISDNGCGMEKKDLTKIFKPFYSTRKTFSNWGLGLATVKRIITLHLGFVEAVSEPNRGTDIQIALPLE